MTASGRIIKGVGGLYFVEADPGAETAGITACRARGKFRYEKITPMIGDQVIIEVLGGGEGYLLEILPRRNDFIRPPVANIDMMAIVASAASPVSKPLIIDRMVAVAINKGIEPLILVNKCDLDRGDDLFDIYNGTGIRTIRTSAVTGEGAESLLDALKDKVSAFSGASGVGKSSLLNTIEGLDEKTGSINERIGRGRHTTRHVELFRLSNGGYIADTPGFTSFDENVAFVMTREMLRETFAEFLPYEPLCRFADCSHVSDRDCAVRAAVEKGEISRVRYESYLAMYDKAKEIKEWETKK